MSDRAGQGAHLIITLRLNDGQDFRCLLDTGAPVTTLPASLQPKLGASRGRRWMTGLDGFSEVQTEFAAPVLRLGDTPLRTGDKVGVSSTQAVLGMDCLQHYCIQLDFESRRIRFLDPDAAAADAAALGKEFLLKSRPQASIDHPGILQERRSTLIVDTGDALDGRVPVEVLRSKARLGHAERLPLNPDTPIPPGLIHPLLFSEVRWDDRTYRDVIVGPGPNLLGLRFLGRYRRVTFNFPRGRLYLDSGNE